MLRGQWVLPTGLLVLPTFAACSKHGLRPVCVWQAKLEKSVVSFSVQHRGSGWYLDPDLCGVRDLLARVHRRSLRTSLAVDSVAAGRSRDPDAAASKEGDADLLGEHNKWGTASLSLVSNDEDLVDDDDDEWGLASLHQFEVAKLTRTRRLGHAGSSSNRAEVGGCACCLCSLKISLMIGVVVVLIVCRQTGPVLGIGGHRVVLFGLVGSFILGAQSDQNTTKRMSDSAGSMKQLAVAGVAGIWSAVALLIIILGLAAGLYSVVAPEPTSTPTSTQAKFVRPAKPDSS